MNSKNIVAIKDERIKCTCMKCLNEYDENHLHIIHIQEWVMVVVLILLIWF